MVSAARLKPCFLEFIGDPIRRKIDPARGDAASLALVGSQELDVS
jgi:hypothetical protein